MRRFIKAISQTLLILGGLVLVAISNVTLLFDVEPIIKDWRVATLVGFGIFAIGALWKIFDLSQKYVWGAMPNVDFIPCIEDTHKDTHFYQIAQLEVKNLEESPIENCYATLVEAEDIHNLTGEWKSAPLIPYMSNKPDRIKWIEEIETHGLCEIKIPPNDSRHINIGDTLGTFEYNLCSGNLSPNWMLPAKLHTVRIRIDGEFNGKSMMPLFFEGYLFYTWEEYGFKMKDVRNGEYWGNKTENAMVSTINFEKGKKGNWMKNKKIRKALKLDKDKEKEPAAF